MQCVTRVSGTTLYVCTALFSEMVGATLHQIWGGYSALSVCSIFRNQISSKSVVDENLGKIWHFLTAVKFMEKQAQEAVLRVQPKNTVAGTLLHRLVD